VKAPQVAGSAAREPKPSQETGNERGAKTTVTPKTKLPVEPKKTAGVSRGLVLPSATASSPRDLKRTLQDSPITVVGIGASAGGLEALSELFRHVPSRTGLAYVVVQHLSPTHSSILAELLAKHAAMPVHEAVDGERVEADHVYVIAPDTKMTLTDGHLKLVQRDPMVRPPLPVDALFRSLAEVQESRTIGIILSGTGSDGVLGVRAIKGAGGITFVQDPASAASEGMPRAAIATNCIDVVAAPADIAAQIARLGSHPYLRASSGESAASNTAESRSAGAHEPLLDTTKDSARDSLDDGPRSDGITIICGLLRHRFGVDFDLYKMGTVERRIHRRMALGKIDTVDLYADVLRSDAHELDTLYGDLLIGVTRFFRDPEVFGILSKSVIPGLLRQVSDGGTSLRAVDMSGDTPLRAWIAGCSTGEEAYSLAISLLEQLGDRASGASLQIFATDLSAASIDVARAGIYPAGIEADVTPERLRRFFTKEENGYRINKTVRDCCVFAVQNITTDPPFSRLDVVSCRNVLIYLQPAAHTRLLALFHYALKPGGVLVLGMSESVSTAASLFTPVDKKHRIFSRLPGPGRPPYLDIAASRTGQSATPANGESLSRSYNSSMSGKAAMNYVGRAPATPDIQRAADHVVLGSYAPASVVVDDQLHILQFRGRTGSYIEPSAGIASFHLLRMVKSELVADLRRAVKTARQEARSVRVERVGFQEGTRSAHVTLDVTPFRVAGAQFFVVSFEGAEENTSDVASHSRADRKTAQSTETGNNPGQKQRADAKELGELRQELEAAQRHLQSITEEHASVIEEFQAANEEIQSSNEELQSTNEEVETSKEELQSLNEELTTLNDELRVRNTDADRLNDDLNNLLSAMHVPVIMVGTDLRIRRFTAGAERLVSLIPTDIGRPIGDIRTNIGVVDLEDLIGQVIESLEEIEREVRDRDGHWYMMHIRSYRTSNGKIDGAVIVYHDIDARKRASEQLDYARQYADAIVQTVREPLLVLDERLRGVSANRAFYRTFRVSPGQTLGHVLFELGDRQWNIPVLRTLLGRVASDGESFDDVEVEHDFGTLGRRVMCLNARRIASERNGPPLILLAIEDITQRKYAEVLLKNASDELEARADQLEITGVELRGKTVEAEASNQAKAEFLATMSHELRTPLNAIAGYAQLIDMGIRGPVTEAQHVDLARITRSQKHLMGLINEILNFAKLEAGAVSVVLAEVSVRDMLAGVKEMLAPQMDRKGLLYEVHDPHENDESKLTLYGDEDKVRQILLNLLTNALKFTAAGGRVEVSCESDDESVTIRVSDTGQGIATGELNSIFDPFVQVNPLLSHATDGVGLGLAISRSLARAMGGDVTAESVLTVGSTFTLKLPRYTSAAG
jgi:two-component system CheB/CheR fusion protein